MIFGLDAGQLPENWTPLEGIAVVKCLDEESVPRLSIRVSEGLNTWEALGMLVTATDQARDDLRQDWSGEDEEEPND